MDNSHLILYVILFSSVFSAVIPLSLAVIQWKKIPRDISLIRWLLIAALVSDATMLILSFIFKTQNQPVGDAFMYVQFTFLLYIFSLQFDHKIIFKVTYVVLTVLYATSLFFPGNSAASTANFDAISSLIFIVVTIVFFYKLLNELKVVNIHRLPILWISFATLFYYSGNLFVFLAVNFLDKENYMLSWTLHNILNITKNILFAIALWQSYRTVKSST